MGKNKLFSKSNNKTTQQQQNEIVQVAEQQETESKKQNKKTIKKLKQKKKIQERSNNRNKDEVQIQEQKTTIRQQKPKLNLNKEKKNNNQQTIQIESSSIEIQQNQQPMQAIQESESEQIQQGHFNPQFKGKHGFEGLIMQNQQKNINQENARIFQFALQSQDSSNPTNQCQKRYLSVIKKHTYYKAISIDQDKMNQTHINQIVSFQIIKSSENLNQSFEVNGLKNLMQHQFFRSTVFKVQQEVRPNSTILPSTNESKKSKKSKKSNIQSNDKGLKTIQLSKKLKIADEQTVNMLNQFMSDFDAIEECLFLSNHNIQLFQTVAPFANFDKKFLQTTSSLLLLGQRNTGKSYLASYIKNISKDQICILDCDIGRSLTISGCISLITPSESIKLWIGQFSPLNCIDKYKKAVERLYEIYRQKYFSLKLVINTMGYLTGLGEMIIYEIYSIINPSEVIILSANSKCVGQNVNSKYSNTSRVIQNIKSGKYISKLLFDQNGFSQKRSFSKNKSSALSLTVQNLTNEHAQGKGVPVRFQNLIYSKRNIKNISELITLIKHRQLKQCNNMDIYEQDKFGQIKILNSESSFGCATDMRIVLIGNFLKCQTSSGLFEQYGDSGVTIQEQKANQILQVSSIGFGFDAKIYCEKQRQFASFNSIIYTEEQKAKVVGVLSQNIDFEKFFYQINEFNMIQLQLQFGELPYLAPVIKGLGSKGVKSKPVKNN